MLSNIVPRRLSCSLVFSANPLSENRTLPPAHLPRDIYRARRNVLDGRTMIEQLSELERRSDPVAIELAGVWTSSYAVVSCRCCCCRTHV